MNIGELCTRYVVLAYPTTTLAQAAQLMREHHVGSLVVARENDAGKTPIGIITDRDMVVEVLAAGLDYTRLTVGDVMSRELVTAREEESALDVLSRMRQRGIRRVPVVSSSGTLTGIISIDDLLAITAEELDHVVKAMSGGQTREARTRR
jgi:CBS domain-containing protein